MIHRTAAEWFLRSFIPVILPLGLWGLLWFSLPGEDSSIPGLLHPERPYRFFLGISAIAPFVAAGGALAYILRRRGPNFRNTGFILSPLGFATIYGTVGLVSLLLAPNQSLSLYWTVVYLSVPAVLWGVSGGARDAEGLSRLINANWIIVVLAVIVLFAGSLFFLGLGEIIIRPSLWTECPLSRPFNGETWLGLTDGFLRSTGVGRYAAIAGIVAAAALWQRDWRVLWGAVFFVSVVLLLTSGARGSLAGFAVAIPFVTVLHGSKKQILVIGSVSAVVLAVFLGTGHVQNFLDTCFWRAAASGIPAPAQSVQVPIQPAHDAISSSSEDILREAARLNGYGPDFTKDPDIVPGIEKSTGSGTGQVGEDTTGQGARQSAGQSAGQSSGTVTGENTGQSGAVKGEIIPGSPGATSSPAVETQVFGFIPTKFFKLSGRTDVWVEGIELFKDSPLLGYGFHADRQILNTHMHNAVLHSMVQTGTLGLLPFLAAIILAWIQMIRIIPKLARLSAAHRCLVIQCAGILLFFTVTMIPESTGAFFSVDWLFLAPVLLYFSLVLPMVNENQE